MKRFKPYRILNIVLSICLLFTYGTISADDTCVFMVTADDVPPNIIILLDNGAEMEKIVPHSSYNSSVDYTPAVAVASQLDVVENGLATGNGFFNGNGYSIYVHGNKYYLADIPASLLVDDHAFSLMADGGGGDPIWTINTRTVTLPADPSASVDADGVKDNATNFRYDKNYLNWLFFGNAAVAGTTDSGGYEGDGSDLPAKSRFYFAKKALMTVSKLTSNQARFGVRNFIDNGAGRWKRRPHCQ